MSWAIAAQVAAQVGLNALGQSANDRLMGAQNIVTKANTAATNLVNQANAGAANSVRAANNTFAAAQASLQNALKSLGNQEKMRVFGQQYNSVETNQARVLDGMVRGKLSARLKGAAALGALRADGAARGVGGSSSEMMRSVLSLQTGAAITTAEDNSKYVQYDALLQKQGLIRTAVNGQDQGQALPSLDYGINVSPVAFNPITALDYQSSALQRAVTSWLGGGGVKDIAKMLGSGGTPIAGGESGGTSEVSLMGLNLFKGA